MPVSCVSFLAHRRANRFAFVRDQVKTDAPSSIREHELLLAVVHERHRRQRDGSQSRGRRAGRRGGGARVHVRLRLRSALADASLGDRRSAKRGVVQAFPRARRGFARQALRDDPVEPLGDLSSRVRVQKAVLGEVGGVAEARPGLRTRILAHSGENLLGFLLPPRVRAALGQVHLDALTHLHLAVTHEVRVFILRACLLVVPGHQGTPGGRPISNARARFNKRRCRRSAVRNLTPLFFS